MSMYKVKIYSLGIFEVRFGSVRSRNVPGKLQELSRKAQGTKPSDPALDSTEL